MTSLIVATRYIVRLRKAVEELQEVVNYTFIKFCYSHCTPTVYKLRTMFAVLTSTLSTQVHTST